MFFKCVLEARILRDEKNDNNLVPETDTHKDVKNYFAYLDNISKALSERLDELEKENGELKSELQELLKQYNEKNNECNDYKGQIEIISKKFIELNEKYEELNEKYDKEQKRYNLVYVENNRNMDELKNLRKEIKLLQSRASDNSKEKFFDKIKKIIK